MTVPPLHVTVTEPSGPGGPLLVLLPSLGTAGDLWDPVVAELARAAAPVRILRVDFPGHGESGPATSPFAVADLAAAVLTAVDDDSGGRFCAAGVSLGGAVALELALVHPERVSSLGMFGSGARIGDPVAWAERATLVRADGTAALVEASAGRWFRPRHLERHPEGTGAQLLDRLTEVDDKSYAWCCEALAAFDRTADVGSVLQPALLVGGEHDPVTTAAAMRELADRLPSGRFAMLADAAHLAVVEQPEAAARLLRELLDAGVRQDEAYD